MSAGNTRLPTMLGRMRAKRLIDLNKSRAELMRDAVTSLADQITEFEGKYQRRLDWNKLIQQTIDTISDVYDQIDEHFHAELDWPGRPLPTDIPAHHLPIALVLQSERGSLYVPFTWSASALRFDLDVKGTKPCVIALNGPTPGARLVDALEKVMTAFFDKSQVG